jgi:hypothetical protein
VGWWHGCQLSLSADYIKFLTHSRDESIYMVFATIIGYYSHAASVVELELYQILNWNKILSFFNRLCGYSVVSDY